MELTELWKSKPLNFAPRNSVNADDLLALLALAGYLADAHHRQSGNPAADKRC